VTRVDELAVVMVVCLVVMKADQLACKLVGKLVQTLAVESVDM
jgi:hypothetical protein